MTIIDHISKKVPEQGNVGACYRILCEVAHPNMLGLPLFLSEQDGVTVISRKRGPSAMVIEHASLLALSWAAGTFPRSLTAIASYLWKDVGRYRSLHSKCCVGVAAAGHIVRALMSKLRRNGLALNVAPFGARHQCRCFCAF